MKKLFKTAILFMLCFAVGIGAGWTGYLYISTKTAQPVTKSQSGVPYAYVPENTGVLFSFAQEPVYCYLDFDEQAILVIFPGEMPEEGEDCFGYPVEHRVTGAYSLLAGWIDRFGGIELEQEGERLRFTGVQVTHLLETTVDHSALEREVAAAVMEAIAQKGVQTADFAYLISTGETDLTIPLCYDWGSHLQEMAKNTRLLN